MATAESVQRTTRKPHAPDVDGPQAEGASSAPAPALFGQAGPGAMHPQAILALQRSAGNSAVAGILARRTAARDDEEQVDLGAMPPAGPDEDETPVRRPDEPDAEVEKPDLSDVDQAMTAVGPAPAVEPDEPVLARTPRALTRAPGPRLQRFGLDDFKKGAGDLWEDVSDTATDVAEDIGDTAGDVGDWISDQASDAWDSFKAKIGQAFVGVLAAFDAVRAAVVGMNPVALRAAWKRLTGVLDAAWSSVKDAGSWIASGAGGVWDTITRPVSGLGRRVAREPSLSDLAGGLKDRVLGAANALLGKAIGLIQKIRSVDIGGIVDKLEKWLPVLGKIREAAADPEALVDEYVTPVAGKLDAETPAKAAEVIAQEGAKVVVPPEPATEASTASDPGLQVARAPDDELTVDSWEGIYDGLVGAVSEKLAQLDFFALVKHAVMTLLWPWPTVVEEVVKLGDDWRAAASGFYVPRSPVDDLEGCLHDVWTNLLHVLDFPLILWRHLNNIGLALMGWVTIILTGLGAVGGAAVGGVLGAIAAGLASLGIGAPVGAAAGAGAGGAGGAGIGFGIAISIGEFLVGSFLLAETAAIAKALLDLKTGRQTTAEKHRDYNQAADSGIALGILGVLVATGWLGGKVASIVGPFLRRIVPKSLTQPLADFLEGIRKTRKKPEKGGKDEEEGKAPPALDKGPLRDRLKTLDDELALARDTLAETGGDAAVEGRLAAAERRSGEIAERIEKAVTEEDLVGIGREIRDVEKTLYELELAVRRIPVGRRIEGQLGRVREMREALDGITAPTDAEAAQMPGVRADLEKVQARLDRAQAELNAARNERQVRAIEKRLDEVVSEVDAVARKDPVRGRLRSNELGIRPEVERDIQVLEQKRKDPFGNPSQAGHNHFDAARREAAGEIVAWNEAKAQPWDHIDDLHNAYNSVRNVRDSLRRELADPLPGQTPKGRAHLESKLALAESLLERVGRFLDEIGWPPDRPHRWVQRDGQWVSETDMRGVQPRIEARLNQIRRRVENAVRDFPEVHDAARLAELRAQRLALLNEIDAARARFPNAQTEAQVRAANRESRSLEDRVDAFELDIYGAKHREGVH